MNQDLRKNENALQQNTKLKLNANGKMKLVNLLTVIMPAQKRYGTTPAEIEAIVEVWSRALGEFDIQQIIDATWQYVKMRPDIPAPSQIENLIRYNHPDGKQEPKGIQIPTQKAIL